MKEFFVGAAVLAGAVGAASARTPVTTHRDTLSIPFSVGSGNSNTHFSIVRDTDYGGVELGIKAKERFVGDANVGGAGALYIVQPGYSPVSGSNPTLDPPRAWWNFDLSVYLDGFNFTTASVTLDIVNNVNSQSMSIDISALMIGAGFGAANVIQDSQNLGFAAFGALGFSALDVGTYDFTLSAVETADGGLNLHNTIQVQVVPMPQAAGLGLIGLAAIAGVRRRR